MILVLGLIGMIIGGAFCMVMLAAAMLKFLPSTDTPVVFGTRTTTPAAMGLLPTPARWPLKHILPLRHVDGRDGYAIPQQLSRVYLGRWDGPKATGHLSYESPDAVYAAGWSDA